eukprot:INCI813.1.p1 GENE.INCI813.1~~INCI813.1.p1  ORF type:complete len:750 (+),score=120.27 INCI813.1:276-2525(+)
MGNCGSANAPRGDDVVERTSLDELDFEHKLELSLAGKAQQREPTAFELMMAENELLHAAPASIASDQEVDTEGPGEHHVDVDFDDNPEQMRPASIVRGDPPATLSAAGPARALSHRALTSLFVEPKPVKAPIVLRSCTPTAAHTVTRRGAPSKDKAGNEDRYCEHLHCVHHGQPFSFFGIFDGHNGPGTAEYLSRRFLHTHLCGSAYTASGCFEKDTIEDTLRRACASADGAILRHMRAQDSSKYKIKRTVSRLRDQLDDSGSTGVFLLMSPRSSPQLPPFATVGWVGDSIAVIVTRSTGKVVPLNPPRTWHTMERNAKERERVMCQEGAEDLVIGGRVLGALKVTRAFGDITGKEPVPILTADPSFYHFEVSDDPGSSPADVQEDQPDQCIILASDGLYDAFRGNLQRLGQVVKATADNPQSYRHRSPSSADGTGQIHTAETVDPAAISAAVLSSAVALDDVTLTVILLGPWKTVHEAGSPCEQAPDKQHPQSIGIPVEDAEDESTCAPVPVELQEDVVAGPEILSEKANTLQLPSLAAADCDRDDAITRLPRHPAAVPAAALGKGAATCANPTSHVPTTLSHSADERENAEPASDAQVRSPTAATSRSPRPRTESSSSTDHSTSVRTTSSPAAPAAGENVILTAAALAAPAAASVPTVAEQRTHKKLQQHARPGNGSLAAGHEARHSSAISSAGAASSSDSDTFSAAGGISNDSNSLASSILKEMNGDGDGSNGMAVQRAAPMARAY